MDNSNHERIKVSMADMTPVHDMSVPNVRMNPLSDVRGNWRQMTMNDG